MPRLPGAKPQIRGVDVDPDLAKSVFLDEIMEQLREEMEAESISFKAILSIFFMVLPGMAGILVTMFSQLQIALLQYFGNYTLNDLMAWSIAFYMGITLGPMLSLVAYGLVSLWALRSFQGVVVIRVVARNPSGSKTYPLDYMGELPKPMRKPKMDELGTLFTSFMKEEIGKLHRDVAVAEVQTNIDKMQQRFAEVYHRQFEKLKSADMKTVTRKHLIIKKDEHGEPVLKPDGMFELEEISVQVPVFEAKRSRLWRVLWTVFIIGMVILTVFIINWVSINMFGFDLLRFIFGFLWG